MKIITIFSYTMILILTYIMILIKVIHPKLKEKFSRCVKENKLYNILIFLIKKFFLINNNESQVIHEVRCVTRVERHTENVRSEQSMIIKSDYSCFYKCK